MMSLREKQAAAKQTFAFLLMLLHSEVQVPFLLMLLRREVQVPFLLMLLRSEVQNLLWVCD